MINCSCHHPAEAHGTAELFGTSMCLTLDCDCEGTRAELEAENSMRRRLPRAVLLTICARYVSDPHKAIDLAAEILDAFNLEAK